MQSKAAQLLLSAVFLLLAFSASASLTDPKLPDFQDTDFAESAAPAEPVDWAALEAENAVLAVLLVSLDDPGNAVIALIPCDPQNRYYRLLRDLQPPLGLKGMMDDIHLLHTQSRETLVTRQIWIHRRAGLTQKQLQDKAQRILRQMVRVGTRIQALSETDGGDGLPLATAARANWAIGAGATMAAEADRALLSGEVPGYLRRIIVSSSKGSAALRGIKYVKLAGHGAVIVGVVLDARTLIDSNETGMQKVQAGAGIAGAALTTGLSVAGATGVKAVAGSAVCPYAAPILLVGGAVAVGIEIKGDRDAMRANRAIDQNMLRQYLLLNEAYHVQLEGIDAALRLLGPGGQWAELQ